MNILKLIKEEYNIIQEQYSATNDEITNFLTSKGYLKNDFYFKNNKLYLLLGSRHVNNINTVIQTLEKKLGWFLSYVENDGEEYEGSMSEFKKYVKYNLENMIMDYEPEDDEVLTELTFEPTYSSIVPVEDIPNIVYHITDEKFVDSIKRKGLLLKNKNKASYHPKRVYLFIKREGLERILDNPNFDVYRPVLLSIDVSNFKNENNFYIDPNLSDGGAYVINNIPPQLIKKYEKIQSLGNF